MTGKLTLILSLSFAAIAMAGPKAAISNNKIVISGLSSAKGLSVVVAEGTEADIAARPAVTGEWRVDEGKVVFTPKYPFKAGTKYRVLGASERLDVATPKADRGKPTVVTQVYPSVPELPENVLRFYIEFNQPMPRGDVYKYVQVLDENDRPDVQPFVMLDNELWNRDQTRLTLLIDPGRIKKEVKPRIDLGPVFRAGKKYTLVVRGEWPTLNGEPLGRESRKPITVTAPLSTGIDPKAWKCAAPSGEKEPLQVAFDRPIDQVILMDALSVIDPDGRELKGKAESALLKNAWSFRPATGWAPGNYKIRIDPVLEDVCGNRVGMPFEVDLSKPRPKETKAVPVDLPFTVGGR